MGSNTWKVLMIKFKLNQHSDFPFFQHFVKVRKKLTWVRVRFCSKIEEASNSIRDFSPFCLFSKKFRKFALSLSLPLLMCSTAKWGQSCSEVAIHFRSSVISQVFYREEINVTVGSERDKIYWKKHVIKLVCLITRLIDWPEKVCHWYNFVDMWEYFW